MQDTKRERERYKDTILYFCNFFVGNVLIASPMKVIAKTGALHTSKPAADSLAYAAWSRDGVSRLSDVAVAATRRLRAAVPRGRAVRVVPIRARVTLVSLSRCRSSLPSNASLWNVVYPRHRLLSPSSLSSSAPSPSPSPAHRLKEV